MANFELRICFLYVKYKNVQHNSYEKQNLYLLTNLKIFRQTILIASIFNEVGPIICRSNIFKNRSYILIGSKIESEEVKFM